MGCAEDVIRTCGHSQERRFAGSIDLHHACHVWLHAGDRHMGLNVVGNCKRTEPNQSSNVQDVKSNAHVCFSLRQEKTLGLGWGHAWPVTMSPQLRPNAGTAPLNSLGHSNFTARGV